MNFDLIIRNGFVIDGSGKREPFQAVGAFVRSRIKYVFGAPRAMKLPSVNHEFLGSTFTVRVPLEYQEPS